MTNKLKILSYNIWFSEMLWEQRTVSLVDVIRKNNPNVICLQEVRPIIFTSLKDQLIEYKYSYPKKVSTRYGCVIFSKYKIKRCWKYPFMNSHMFRSLYVVNIEIPIESNDDEFPFIDVIIATSHFESVFSQHNVEKINQYQYVRKVLDLLSVEYKNIILCADTNVMSYEEDSLNDIFVGYIDAWAVNYKTSDEYTFNSECNPYLFSSINKVRYMSRLDRILYTCNDFLFNDFHLVGKNTANTDDMSGKEPSDHYGVCVELYWY